MKLFGWINISMMGFVLNLSVNGHHGIAIFLGLVMTIYFFLKFSKWVDFTTLLSGVLASFMIILSFWKVDLLGYSPQLIVISLYLGLNTGLFLTILLKSSPKQIEKLTASIHFYTLVLLGLITLIFMVPNHLLCYFLYPHYLEGGFKEALFVIVSIMFAPYILIHHSYPFIHGFKLETSVSLVSTKNVIQ